MEMEERIIYDQFYQFYLEERIIAAIKCEERIMHFDFVIAL